MRGRFLTEIYFKFYLLKKSLHLWHDENFYTTCNTAAADSAFHGRIFFGRPDTLHGRHVHRCPLGQAAGTGPILSVKPRCAWNIVCTFPPRPIRTARPTPLSCISLLKASPSSTRPLCTVRHSVLSAASSFSTGYLLRPRSYLLKMFVTF